MMENGKGENIQVNVIPYYTELTSNKNHRYQSWEHCYLYFGDQFKKKNLTIVDIDLLSLHLAFYLASWGMYRGSSFILQKDYKVFVDIIKLLHLNKDKFNDSTILYTVLSTNENTIDEYVKEYFEFDEKLEELLNHIRCDVKGKVSNRISDTLKTKILLGTLGCIPAYDRLFKKGIGNKSDFDLHKSYSIGGMKKLLRFVKNNITEIHSIQSNIGDIQQSEIKKSKHVNYPIMKIIDMYFWQIGFNLEESEKEKEDIVKC